MRFRRVLSVAVLLAATIALAHTQSLDDPQQWRGVALARALAAADTIDDPYRRAETLASIARVQTLIGETASDRTIHLALAAVAQIREPAFRDWVLNDVVLAQIAAEDLAGARETANRIEAKRQQGAALVQIATVELRAGNIAGRIETGYTHDPQFVIDMEASQLVSPSGDALGQRTGAHAGREHCGGASETLTAVKGHGVGLDLHDPA